MISKALIREAISLMRKIKLKSKIRWTVESAHREISRDKKMLSSSNSISILKKPIRMKLLRMAENSLREI
jgi:hypothetical protein